jgi:hypothetical protein
MNRTQSKVKYAIRLLVVAAVLCSPAPHLVAKVSSMSLAEMVKKSPIIVYGETFEADGSSPARNVAWVAFKTLVVVRGPESLAKEVIYLCNSQPPMMDYPDLRKWADGVGVLFLAEKNDGCFQLVHSYVSVVDVRGNQASTAAIADQPISQPLGHFLKKVRSLIQNSGN